MSRTVSAGLATHLATGKTTLARCLCLELRDGTRIGITTLDVDLTVNLSGDSPGSVTYQAATGVLPSAIQLTLGLDADNFEARGPIGTLVTRAAVLGGRFDRASAWLFDVNYLDTSQILRLMKGKISSARVEGGEFIFEVRSLADSFNQTIGRVLTPLCSHDFGVGQCQATPQTWAGTVATVTDEMVFTVNWTDSPAPTSALALGGKVTFTSGDLAGTLPVEVFSYSGTTVTLFAPLVEAPAVGDALVLTEGCEKTRTACKAKGQILNMGGFPEVPGTDQYLKYPVPGE